MNAKSFAQTASLVFLAVTIGHLLRLLNSWEVAISDWSLPFWASWIAVFVAGTLAWQGFRLAK